MKAVGFAEWQEGKERTFIRIASIAECLLISEQFSLIPSKKIVINSINIGYLTRGLKKLILWRLLSMLLFCVSIKYIY